MPPSGHDPHAGSSPEPVAAEAPELVSIATAFVDARRAGRALAEYPGQLPDDLDTAYRVQDIAIRSWPDELVGWKIGFITAENRDSSGVDRLLGPVWRTQLTRYGDQPATAAIFAGGFGALEAEYVLRLAADVPAYDPPWEPEAALAHPAALHVGLEVASSPLASINALGPRAVISDFGNNNGLVVGPEIDRWRERSEEDLTVETFIDDHRAGTGGAARLPGGIAAAYAFALSCAARRGIRLRAGQYLATGALTGIHEVTRGQHVAVVFAGLHELQADVVESPTQS